MEKVLEVVSKEDLFKYSARKIIYLYDLDCSYNVIERARKYAKGER